MGAASHLLLFLMKRALCFFRLYPEAPRTQGDRMSPAIPNLRLSPIPGRIRLPNCPSSYGGNPRVPRMLRTILFLRPDRALNRKKGRL